MVSRILGVQRKLQLHMDGGVGRTIRDLWSYLEENPTFSVGRGDNFKFWRDGWIVQAPLSESFPDLYSICTNPDAKVCDCWSAQGWDLSFQRLLNYWEIEGVASLLGKLGDARLDTNAGDRVIWKHNKDGKFTVNIAYKRRILRGDGRVQYQWKNIWRGSIPTKVKCFTWLVIKRASLNQEVLQKKGRKDTGA